MGVGAGVPAMPTGRPRASGPAGLERLVRLLIVVTVLMVLIVLRATHPAIMHDRAPVPSEATEPGRGQAREDRP